MRTYPFPPKVRDELVSLEAQKRMLLTGWMAGQGIPDGPYRIADDLSGLVEQSKPVGDGFAPPRNRKENTDADGATPDPPTQNSTK